MLSFDRRSFLTLPLALAACGFSPAYGPDGPALPLRGKVRAADPSDKNGFDLVAGLEARLGLPDDPAYDLTYTIRTETVGTGIATDNTVTRFNLLGKVDWTLTDLRTKARLTGGTVESFTAWSATASTVAGLSAEEDAALRLMQILADQIVTRIVAAASGFPG